MPVPVLVPGPITTWRYECTGVGSDTDDSGDGGDMANQVGMEIVFPQTDVVQGAKPLRMDGVPDKPPALHRSEEAPEQLGPTFKRRAIALGEIGGQLEPTESGEVQQQRLQVQCPRKVYRAVPHRVLAQKLSRVAMVAKIPFHALLKGLFCYWTKFEPLCCTYCSDFFWRTLWSDARV